MLWLLKRVKETDTKIKLKSHGLVFSTLNIVNELGGKARGSELPCRQFSSAHIGACEVLGFLKRIETFSKKIQAMSSTELSVQVALGVINPKPVRVDYELTEVGKQALEMYNKYKNFPNQFIEVPIRIDQKRYKYFLEKSW